MFRRKADRIIDSAHNAICAAEIAFMHAYTDADKQAAGDQISAAQRYLRRAVDAKCAWDAAEHDDYEEYPDVPESDQDELPNLI